MARRLTIERRVGERIRALREEARLTQRELAEKVGTSRSQVAGIEHGQASPTIGTLEAFAAALHTTIGSLLNSGDALQEHDRPARLAAKLRTRPPEFTDMLDRALDCLDRAAELGPRPARDRR